MKNKTMQNTREAVMKGILRQTEPYCLNDLYQRLEESGVSNDKELILQALDYLYEWGLVSFVFIKELDNGDELWAFRTCV